MSSHEASRMPAAYSPSQGGGVQEYQWQLTDVSDASGKQYLLDPATKVVFFKPLRSTDWPKVYGRLDEKGQVVAMERKNEKGLFAALDAKLKAQQLRFKDVYDEYRGSKEGLDPPALLRLLVHTLPDLTQGDLMYFQVMLDVDGDGQVSYDEFLSVVKEGMEVESAGMGPGASSSTAGLEQLSACLKQRFGEAQALFQSFDSARKGCLQYPDLGRLIKKLLPGMGSKEKRHIFSYLASMDVAQQGSISFAQLVRYLRASPDVPQQRGSLQGRPGDVSWRLEEWREGGGRGEQFLLDPQSGRLYKPTPDWPTPAGMLVNNMRYPKKELNPGSLFNYLDAYLRETHTRLADLFSKYDVNGDGELTLLELATMLRNLQLKDVSNADILYFMALMDADGSGTVSQSELLSSAKLIAETHAHMHKGGGKTPQDVLDLLQRISQYISGNMETVRDVWAGMGASGNGTLEPTELAAFIRRLVKGIGHREQHYLLMHMADMDVAGNAQFDFSALCICLRVVPPKTPPGYPSYQRGFKPDFKPSAGRPGDVSWRLEEWREGGGRGEQFLLDPQSGRLYKPTPDWPTPAGMLVNNMRYPKKELNPGSLFNHLDAYLRETRTRLSDLFGKYDVNGDGELTLLELAKMLRDLQLKDVSNADILYFMALMDADGSGTVSQSELLSSAKLIAETHAHMHKGGGKMPQDVLDLLQRISQYISGNMETVRDVWAGMGASGNGTLEPTELAAFIRRLVKGIGHREQHYLLMHMADMDVAGNAQFDFSALCICLRVVPPKTPPGYPSYQRGFEPDFKPSAGRPGDVSWRLEEWREGGGRGEQFLLDPQSGRLYKPTPDWPTPAGMLVNNMRYPKKELNPGSLFNHLDAYLRETRTRLSDLFGKYDVNGDGELTLLELATMLRDLQLKDVSNADILYFMALMDADGSGTVSQSELLSSAKLIAETHAHMHKGGGKTPQDVLDLLQRISQYISGNMETVRDVWAGMGASGNGTLEPTELAAFIRRLVKGIGHREQHYLLMHMADMDVAGNAQFDFSALCICLRVVPPKTPPGYPSYQRGFKPDFKPSAGRPGDVSWRLEEWREGGGIGEQFLLDPQSGRLYKPTPDWPTPAGMLVNNMRYPKKELNPGSLFNHLDAYLRETRTRLSDLFGKYDVNGDGELTLLELAKMLRDLQLKDVSNADILYFMALMDADGSGTVSQSELLSSAKLIAETHAHMHKGGGKMPQDVLDLLQRISQYISGNMETVRDVWAGMGASGNGTLEPTELAAFIRRLVKGIGHREQHYLLMHMADMDVAGNAQFDFSALCICLRVVPPKTPPGYPSYQRGFKPDFKPSAGRPGDVSWRLEEWREGGGRGEQFLLDPQSGRLYKPTPDWPTPAGMLVNNMRYPKKELNPGSLFNHLDAYLRETRTRLSDLFGKYDVNGDGELTLLELATMLRDLQLKDVSNADILYFMALMDADGSGTVSQSELLSSAKLIAETHAHMHKGGGKTPQDVLDLLQRISQYISGNMETVRDVWAGMGASGNGTLEPTELAAFIRRLVKGIGHREQHYLLMHMADMDVAGNAQFDFSALCICLRVVPPKTPPGYPSYQRGFKPDFKPSAGRPGDVSWRLEEWREGGGRGEQFLLDPQSGRLYKPTPDWPTPAGMLVNNMRYPKKELNPGSLFNHLDAYLRETRTRLSDLFGKYDVNGDGELTLLELAKMLRDLQLKDVSNADILYFMALMDADGSGTVSQSELLSSAKLIAETHAHMHKGGGKMPQDVLDLLQRISQYISGNMETVRDVWAGMGASGNGTLEPTELAAFIRRLVKGIGHREQHYLLMHMADMDVAGNAQFDFSALCICLRVVPPKTPPGYPSYQRGFEPDFKPSAGRPGDVSWRLEEWREGGGRGEQFLLDPQSGRLYKPTPDWPTPAGMLVNNMRYPKKELNPGSLFNHLDAYLRETRTRLSDLFGKYDVNGDGELTLLELAKMLRDLQLKDVSNADILYFMALMDADGSGTVSQSELLSSAKLIAETHAHMHKGGGKMPQDVLDLLQRISQYISGNMETVRDVWAGMGASGNGTLEPTELAAFIRRLVKGIGHREQHYLLMHMADMDVAGNAQFDFSALCICLRVVPPKTPPGYPSYQRGFKPDFKPSAGRPGDVSWRLEEWREGGGRGEALLLDSHNGRLYKPTPDWPTPAGMLVNGRMQPKKDVRPGEMFGHLDAYLKQSRTRLAELFKKYDVSGDGELDLLELASLLRDLRLPGVGNADILYFMALMDADGSGTVNQNELLSSAKVIAEDGRRMRAAGGHMPEDVLDLLQRISQYISGNMETVRDVWAGMGASGNGTLEPTELAAFIRRLVKGIGHREQHYLLMHMADMDVAGEALISFADLCICLRVVPPKLPPGYPPCRRGFKQALSSASARSAMGRVDSRDVQDVWVLTPYLPSHPPRISRAGSSAQQRQRPYPAGAGTLPASSAAAAAAARQGSGTDPGQHLEMLQQRQQLLLDPLTCRLYSRPESPQDWPHAVGFVHRTSGPRDALPPPQPRSRMYGAPSGSAASAQAVFEEIVPFSGEAVLASGRAFFAELEKRISSGRMQPRDLFLRYDRNRSGRLDSQQLHRLVTDLMDASATDAQIAYCQAVLDCGFESLSLDAWTDLFQEFTQGEERSPKDRGGGHGQFVVQELKEMSLALSRQQAMAAVAAAFSRKDASQIGSLTPSEALSVLRVVSPTLSAAALRRLALEMWLADAEGSGAVTLRTLKQAARAVDVQTPDFVVRCGTWAGSVDKGAVTAVQLLKSAGGSDGSAARASFRVEQPLLALVLEAFEHKGSRYLIDRRTGLVYEQMPRNAAKWPKPVAVLEKSSLRAIPMDALSGSKVFSSLDVMLRRDQSRFLDLFRRASRKPPGHMPATDPYGSYGHSSSYSGYEDSLLAAGEVAELVKDMLGAAKVTPGDAAYVEAVLRLHSYHSISDAQLMDVVKDFAGVERCLSSGNLTDEVWAALSEASETLAKGKEDAFRSFQQADTHGTGSLDLQALPAFLVDLVPVLSNREITILLAHLHGCDFQKRGSLSFNELQVALHAVPLKYPGGQIPAGFPKPQAANNDFSERSATQARSQRQSADQLPYRGSQALPATRDASVYSPFGRSSRQRLPPGDAQDPASAAQQRLKEGLLVDLEPMVVGGQSTLVDLASGYVYSPPQGNEYPAILGRLDAKAHSLGGPAASSRRAGSASQPGLLPPVYTPENDLFAYMEYELQSGTDKLLEVFESLDVDGSGLIFPMDLEGFGQAVLPDATPEELQYFKVMVDCEESEGTDFRHLTQAIKECALSVRNAASPLSPGAADVLGRASTAIRSDKANAEDLFQAQDVEGTGQLSVTDQAAFFRCLMPGLKQKELRTLVAYLHLLCTNGSNAMTLTDICCRLHVPDLRFPANSADTAAPGSGSAIARASSTSLTRASSSALGSPRSAKRAIATTTTRSGSAAVPPPRGLTQSARSSSALVVAQGGAGSFPCSRPPVRPPVGSSAAAALGGGGVGAVRGASNRYTQSWDGDEEVLGEEDAPLERMRTRGGAAMLRSSPKLPIMELQDPPPSLGPGSAMAAELLAPHMVGRGASYGRDRLCSHPDMMLALDDESGLLYAVAEEQHTWPTLVGYIEMDGNIVEQVPPLCHCTTYGNLVELFGSTEDGFATLTAAFTQAAGQLDAWPTSPKAQSKGSLGGRARGADAPWGGRTGSASSQSREGWAGSGRRGREGVSLDVASVVPLLDRLYADYADPEGQGQGLDYHSLSLIESLLPLLCGPTLGPSKLIKALSALHEAVQRLAAEDGDGAHEALALTSSALGGQHQPALRGGSQSGPPAATLAATLECMEAFAVPPDAHMDRQGRGVLLDPQGLLGVLQQRAGAALPSKQDLIAAVVWAYYHAPPAIGGLIAGMDVLKAFRAAKCRLPDGTLLPPGFGGKVYSRTVTHPAAQRHRPGKALVLHAAASAPLDYDYDEARDVAGGAGQLQLSRARIAKLRGVRSMDLDSEQGHMLRPASAPMARRASVESERRALLQWPAHCTLSLPQSSTAADGKRPGSPGAPLAQPSVHSSRRCVMLRPSTIRDGTGQQLMVDPESGLLYCPSQQPNSVAWPDLVGKTLPSSNSSGPRGQTRPPKTIWASPQGFTHMVDALHHIAKNGSQLLKVFRKYDTNRNGTLELQELVQLCRQEFPGLSHSDICFMQAMLDADVDGLVSFDEFLVGIHAAAAALDAVHRGDSQLKQVLHTASMALAQDLGAFWDAFRHHDRDGNGFLDAAELTRFFQDLFAGIPALELRLLVAYVAFMDVDKDGLVRPDELLQFLHAIPMADPNGVIYQPGFPTIPSSTYPSGDPSGSAANIPQREVTRKLAWQPAADQVPIVSPSASFSPPPPVVTQTLPAAQAQTAQAVYTGPSPHAVSPAYTGSPYAVSSPPTSPHAGVAQPPSTPPMGAVPYMMAGLPGQPPVVGYILPYQQDLFQQLVAQAVHSPARSPSSSRPASPAVSRPSSPPLPAFYQAPPAPEAQINQQQQQQQACYPTINQLPPQRQSFDQSSFASGRVLPSPRQRSSYDARGNRWTPPVEEGVEVLDEFAEDSKRSNSPVTDYPQLRDINYPQQQQQYRQDAGSPQQQQQQQQQWAPPYGPYAQQQLVGNAQHTPWPQSSSLVTSGGGPYAQAAGFPTRQGPFGLMQELERFLISRRAQMLDFFAMAASSVHGLPPSTSGRPSTVGSGARGIAVTRPALVGVVQRAVPSASVHDTRYVQAIIDALLPHQRMISMEDWEGCVFQGAAAEAAVLQRTLPLSLLAPLRSLADAWQSAPGARAHAVKRFQELDFDRSGYLSTSDQQLLLSSLLGLPPPVGMPAAYSNPAAFPSAKGHSAAGDMGIAMSSAEAGLWLCVALHSQLPTGSRPGFMTFNELEQAVQFMAYQFSPSPLYSTQQQQQQQQQLMASAPNPYSGRDMSPQRSLESGPGYSGPYAQYGRDISPQRSLESVPPYAQYGRDLTPQRSMQSVPAYDAPNAQYARDPSPPRSMQSGPAYDVPHAQYGRDLSPRRSMQGVPGYTGPQAPYGRDSSRPRSWAGEDPYGWPSRRFAGQGGGPDSWGSAYEDAGGPASTSPHTSHGSMSDAAMYGGAVPAGAYPRSSSPPPPHFDSTPAAGGVRFRDDAMGSVDAQRFDEAVFSQAGRYTGNPGAAYHAWTYENRQKVLDTYFNRDHQRKMRTLRSQKDKADAAAALEEAIEAKEDAAAETRERLWRLAKRAEKDAYEHTGYKPLKMLEVDEVAERINAALDAAVSITRKKSLLEGTGYEGSRSMDMYRPPPDLRSLLDQICSPGWYERMALPANLETLKVALAVRKDALELARLQDASVQAAHFAVQGVEMAGQEAKHAMGVQAALLQDALMARTAELERCLLADAYAVASQASATAQHAAFAAQHQDNRLSGMPVPRQHSLKPPQQQQQQQQQQQRLQGPAGGSPAFRPAMLPSSTPTTLLSASQMMAPTSAASGPAMLPGAASFVHPPHVAAMPPPGVYAGRGSGGMGWVRPAPICD